MSFPHSSPPLPAQPSPAQDESARLAQAAGILKAGGLVAFPTETVYGLGADAENPDALERLYRTKGRPKGHPVIVHLADMSQLEAWACDIPSNALTLARVFWPGPLTLILKRSGRVPDAVTGGQDTVGIRVPSHPMALQLLQAFGGGIAAPSANRFGRLSPTCARHVEADLGADVDLILDGGACQVGVESTIVAFQGEEPVVLRPGMITTEQIEVVIAQADSEKMPGLVVDSTVSRAPGTLASHYAPNTRLRLVPAGELEAVLEGLMREGLSVGALACRSQPATEAHRAVTGWIEMASDPAVYAKQLYAQLRRLDDMRFNCILVEEPPTTGAWAAVTDRLRRAAFSADGDV